MSDDPRDLINREVTQHYLTTGRCGEISEDGSFSWLGKLSLRWRPLDGNLPKLSAKFKRVVGDFDVSNQKLKSLEGCPEIVEGQFDCSFNYDLTNLSGGPHTVTDQYRANHCNLENLVGVATDIGEDLYVRHNLKLASLAGVVKVHSYIVADDCHITDLSALPKGLYMFISSWHRNLPMLRMVLGSPAMTVHRQPPELEQIMDRYANQGRDAVIPCAAELHKSGYEGNAKL